MSAPRVSDYVFLIALAGCSATSQTRLPDPATRTEITAPDRGGGELSLRNPGEALANFALSLQGTRYRYGGASRDGFDCSGLVFYAHRRLGLEVPRTSSDQAQEAGQVKRRKLERGDLVFFKIDSRKVNHVGIYVGDHRFVHAPGDGKPVTVSSLDDEFYAQSFSGAGRYWDRLSH
ncbi:MAG TPA: C40 family peptidase [Steroidobacteraceae bacterium]